MLTKLNVFILGCIFLFVTPIMASDTDGDSSELVSTPQVAKVIVPRAIVYSDELMNSPLGYISNDKLIRVGNPRKRNPGLVPLVIYGRLAFIESKNIHLENDPNQLLSSKHGANLEHNIDLVLIKTEEKISENNSAYLSLHQFAGGEEIKNIVNTINGSPEDTFTGFGISLIHRQVAGRVFYGLGYEYNWFTTPNLKMELYTLAPIVGYTPIRNSLFLIDLTLSLDLASAHLKIENNYTDEPPGFVWGPQLGARIVLFPKQTYHAIGSFGYRSYRVERLKQLVDTNGEYISDITKISGINMSIGVAFEL